MFTHRRSVLLNGRGANIPRNIASGMRAPGYGGGGLAVTGSNTTQNYRSQHVNESGSVITSAAIIDSSWYTNQLSTSLVTGNEAVAPNNFTITRSIEYPAGVFTQIKWGGATSLLVTPGLNVVSDYVSIIIPAGATYWIRSWLSVSAGGTWLNGGSLASASGSFVDQCEFGIGLADKTMGGSIVGSSQGHRPSAMISNVPGLRLSLAGAGDSIMAGSGDTGVNSSGNIAWLGRAATGVCPYLASAVGGTTSRDQAPAGRMALRLDLWKKAGITHVVWAYGVNDMQISRTALQLEADNTACANNIVGAGIKCIPTTLTPEGSSTQSWLTTSSQTPNVDVTQKTIYNTWLRAGQYPFYSFIENGWTLEDTPNTGLWGATSAHSPYLGTADTWVVSAGATTTSIPSNANKPVSGTSYYLGGHILFTSGVNNGVFTSCSYNTIGTFTVPALPSAPAAGDTFIAYQVTAQATSDGRHPNVTGNRGTICGGHIELMNNVLPLLTTLKITG